MVILAPKFKIHQILNYVHTAWTVKFVLKLVLLTLFLLVLVLSTFFLSIKWLTTQDLRQTWPSRRYVLQNEKKVLLTLTVNVSSTKTKFKARYFSASFYFTAKLNMFFCNDMCSDFSWTLHNRNRKRNTCLDCTLYDCIPTANICSACLSFNWKNEKSRDFYLMI